MPTLELSEARNAAETPRTKPLLHAEGLGKSFGAKPVLSDLSLSIQEGEIVAIVGRSGCGKSTLLRILAGLERPSTGRIILGQAPLAGLNRSARLMFQDAALLPWKTVLQNVTLGALHRDREIAGKALAQVGLGDRPNDWPAVLSGGQRQRVALARALASRARLLLFDEPLGALDALTRLEMQHLIEHIWQYESFAAVLITHDVEEAITLGDRILVMEGGRLIQEFQVPFARPRDRASEAFVNLRERVLGVVLRGGL